MKPIIRGQGQTASERYLAKLADRTFLNLWSYPNTFIDKKQKQGSDGKELCDLLVISGNDIIIFSDKSINWPDHANFDVSWSRWFKRAVIHSVDQIRGAERWIKEFPNRIFTNPSCTQPFPYPLPDPTQARFYRIAVAVGAREACKNYYKNHDGSLMIFGPLKGNDHIDPAAKTYMPFAIGDVDPTGHFVHVFDESALDFVLNEMDTVSDFTRYLAEREKFIRNGILGHSPNEAEMIALYFENADASGEHIFPTLSDLGASEGQLITLSVGSFSRFANSFEYKAKKAADKVSYTWDKLIGIFTEHVIAGTSVSVLGETPSAALAEPGLRIMAREPRIRRRALGEAFLGALEKSKQHGKPRYARVVLPNSNIAGEETGYVFVILGYPTDRELKGGYDQYRRTRIGLIDAYCYSVLHQHRHLKRMVGIGVDASSEITGRQGGSEDLVVVEIDEWTSELEEEAQERKRQFNVMDESRITTGEISVKEFPVTLSIESNGRAPGLNRQERRAAAKRAKKS